MKTKKLLNVLMLFVLTLGLFAMTIPSVFAAAASSVTYTINGTPYIVNASDNSVLELTDGGNANLIKNGNSVINITTSNSIAIKGNGDYTLSEPDNMGDVSYTAGDDIELVYRGGEWVFLHFGEQIAESSEFRISIKFLGSNTKPAVSGKDTIINNVSSPYTVAQLKDIAQIKVIDEYDGDITNQLQVKTDSYTANKSSVGTSTVTYIVTNSGGLSTEYVLTILTKDMTAPSISGPTSTRIPYTQTITSADIIAKYIVTDNYDSAVTLVVESTDYVSGKVGSYTFNLKATDKAGNSATAVHTLSTYDDVVPVITNSMTGAWKVPFKTAITDALLLSNLTANDAIDGNLTSRIKVKTSDVVPGKLGLYTVTYEVVDNAGNVGTFSRPFEIITLDYPVYYVSGNIISIEDANKLTIDQIAQMYAELNNIDMHSYTVMTNDYFGNESTPGTYLLSMKIMDKKGTSRLVENMMQVVALDNGEAVNPSNPGTWLKNNPVPTALIIVAVLAAVGFVTYKLKSRKK